MSNSSNGDAFSITDAQIHFSNVLQQSCTIPGTCVCFLVLVAYGFAVCFPRARRHMHRVSFRLIIYSLIFNVLFGIAYAAAPTSPGVACNIEAFCVNLFLCFSTFCTCCIAINLQLVVVHHVDGRRMEKYYLIGTILLSLVLNVPTLALDQFGWDEGSSTCRYKNSDPTLRLYWIIGTKSFWIALAATIETICSCVLLAKMYRWQKNARASFIEPITHNESNNETTMNAMNTTRDRQSIHDPRCRKVISRIVLYPIVSLIVNYSTVALDLNNTIQGTNTQLEFRLLAFDIFLYGIRTLLYGLLAAVDPSFTTALREMLYRNKDLLDKPSTSLKSELVVVNSEYSPGHSQVTTRFGEVTQSHLNSEWTWSERERMANMDAEQRSSFEMMGQDLESNVHYDPELELELARLEGQL